MKETIKSDRDEVAPAGKNTKLELGFTTFGAWSLGVGALIGSMAWLVHAPMIATAGCAGATLAWLLSGVFVGALSLNIDGTLVNVSNRRWSLFL